MTLKILTNHIFINITLIDCHPLRNVIMDVITKRTYLLTTGGLSILLHGIMSLPDATSNLIYCPQKVGDI